MSWWGRRAKRKGTNGEQDGGGREKVGEDHGQDQEVDAEEVHAAAVRELTALLATPENLSRLGKLKKEYEGQRSSVEVQISLLTGRQTEDARTVSFCWLPGGR